MLVNELLYKFDFHDSNVIKLLHDKENLILIIDFCMWKQIGYSDSEEELKEVRIEFIDVQQFIWDSQKNENEIDYDTILNFSYDGKRIRIVLEDEVVSVISFECTDVKFLI